MRRSKYLALLLFISIITGHAFAEERIVEGLPCNSLCQQWLGATPTDLARPVVQPPDDLDVPDAPRLVKHWTWRTHRSTRGSVRAKSLDDSGTIAKRDKLTVRSHDIAGPPPNPSTARDVTTIVPATAPSVQPPAVQPLAVLPPAVLPPASASTHLDKRPPWQKTALSIFEAADDPVVMPFKAAPVKLRNGRRLRSPRP